MIIKEFSVPVCGILPAAVPLEQLMFFDIETTGLSPKAAEIYLLGTGVPDASGKNLCIRQFLSENAENEPEILDIWIQLLSSHPYVVSYNGAAFDLRFLQERCRYHHRTMPSYTNIDLMRAARWMKKQGLLSDCRLTTVERALGVCRQDVWSGGELIAIYQKYRLLKKLLTNREDCRLPHFDPSQSYSDYSSEDYLLASSAALSPSGSLQEELDEMEQCLLLHNREDVAALLSLLALQRFFCLCHTPVLFSKEQCEALITSVEWSEKELLVRILLPFFVSRPENLTPAACTDGICVSIRENVLFLSLSVFQGELKLFYEDYRSYVYLPYEDTAVHKSVGEFIAKERKEPARKSTCYSRHTGSYLPLIRLPKQSSFSIFRSSPDAASACFCSTEEVRQNPTAYLFLLLSQLFA